VARAEISASQLRKTAITEFSEWLRTRTNKNKLPFQERAIENYAEAAEVLDRWMTEQDDGPVRAPLRPAGGRT
jgi:hypothetical protein